MKAPMLLLPGLVLRDACWRKLLKDEKKKM